MSSPPQTPCHDAANIFQSTSPQGDASYNSTLSPSSPASPGSPVRTIQGRSIRRKRSAANAALTSRPSQLSLRERSSSFARAAAVASAVSTSSSSSTSGTSGSAKNGFDLTMDNMASLSLGSPTVSSGQPLSLSNESIAETPTAMETYEPSTRLELELERELNRSNLVLVHTIREPGSKDEKLHHALFQPNFLIDGQGRSKDLDRENWENLRARVEEARIVGSIGKVEKGVDTTSESGFALASSTKLLDQDEHEEDNQKEGGDYEAFFDLAPKGTLPGSLPTSTFYLQLQASQYNDSQQRQFPLIRLRVHGVGASTATTVPTTPKAQFNRIPNQLQALLQQSDFILSFLSQGEGMTTEIEGGAILCNHILTLLSS